MATPPVFLDAEILYASQLNKIGMWLVKTQTIGSAVQSVAVTGAFSADYENYKIIISGGVASTLVDLNFVLTGSTANYYQSQIISSYATGAVTGAGTAAGSSWTVGYGSTSALNANIDIQGPNLAKTTQFSCARPTMSTSGSAVFVSGFHNVTTAYTGLTISTFSGTITGGTIRIYGYRD